MIKAIPVRVYKDERLGDCTNGGISSRFDELLIVCDDGYIDIDESNGLPENLCQVVEVCRGHKAIEPFAVPDAGRIGWMYGGNIADTCDSRFSKLSGGYPLHIHDRQETPEEVALILKDIADRIRGGRRIGAIMDINGNKVGEFKLK